MMSTKIVYAFLIAPIRVTLQAVETYEEVQVGLRRQTLVTWNRLHPSYCEHLLRTE